MITPAEFWQQLASAESQRKARESHTREMKARPQYRVAQNDEPEPRTAAEVIEAGQADARAELRKSRRPVPHLQPGSKA